LELESTIYEIIIYYRLTLKSSIVKVDPSSHLSSLISSIMSIFGSIIYNVMVIFTASNIIKERVNQILVYKGFLNGLLILNATQTNRY